MKSERSIAGGAKVVPPSNSRRWLFAAGGLVVAGGIGLVTVCSTDPEPRWDGKPIRHWVRLRAHSRSLSVPSLKVTRAAGTNSIPALVKALNTQDTALARRYRVLWTNTPTLLQPHLPRPVEPFRVRRAAASILAELGTNAVAAIPALTLALKDPDDGVQAGASYALRMIDPPDDTLQSLRMSFDAPPRRGPKDSNEFGVRFDPPGSRSARSVQFLFRTNLMRTNPPARP